MNKELKKELENAVDCAEACINYRERKDEKKQKQRQESEQELRPITGKGNIHSHKSSNLFMHRKQGLTMRAGQMQEVRSLSRNR